MIMGLVFLYVQMNVIDIKIPNMKASVRGAAELVSCFLITRVLEGSSLKPFS
jgi:hypothetical protein